MKTSPEIQKIITTLGHRHGIDFKHPGAYMRLEMDGFNGISIENIGTNLLSVAHYFDQEGDLVADPDVVFFTGYAEWVPISIQNQFCFSEAAVVHDDHTGLKGIYVQRQAELADFCWQWAKNLRAQGWLQGSTCTRRKAGWRVIAVDVDLRKISLN